MSTEKNKRLEDYIWIFAIISAMVSLVAIFTPAILVQIGGVSLYIWRYGYYLSTGTVTSSSGFFTIVQGETDLTIVVAMSVLNMIVRVVGTLVLIFSGLKARKFYAFQSRTWFFIGIIFIFSEVIWLAGMSAVNVSYGILSFELWDYVQLGAGSILGFISGSIALFLGALGEFMR